MKNGFGYSQWKEREIKRMELTQTTHSHSQCERVYLFVCSCTFVYLCSLCWSLHQLQTLSIASRKNSLRYEIETCSCRNANIHNYTFRMAGKSMRESETCNCIWRFFLGWLLPFWNMIQSPLQKFFVRFRLILAQSVHILSMSWKCCGKLYGFQRVDYWLHHIFLLMWITSHRKWEMKVIVTS